MGLEISSYSKSDVLIIKLSGDLDALTAPECQTRLLSLITPDQCKIVLDMSELTFLTNAGLRVFVTVVKEARRAGGDMRLARLQPAVQDVVAMGLAKLIRSFNTLEGAITSYRGPVASGTRRAGRNSLYRLQTWSDDFLDRMRMVGDPPADAAVQALIAQEQITSVNKLMKTLVTNDYIPPSDLPPVIRNYLEHTSALPSWADWSRIQRGQQFFERYGIQIITILFCGSLPRTYAARKGVHVLWMTQRMNRNPYRRITETAQMILDVMTPGGLQPGGSGLRSIQKVRLMHAAIRQLLLNSGQWDSSAYDHPINQEDLAGTLMAFSHAVAVGLPLLGIHVTKEQEEDYLHIWNVVGYLMGISTEMLPVNADRAKALSHIIFSRHIVGTPTDHVEGRELTASLITMMQETMATPLLSELPAALIRHLTGDSISDLLGVEAVPWQGAIKSLQLTNQLLEQSTDNLIVGRAVAAVFRQLVKKLMQHGLDGQRASFRIPESLAEGWGITQSEPETE